MDSVTFEGITKIGVRSRITYKVVKWSGIEEVWNLVLWESLPQIATFELVNENLDISLEFVLVLKSLPIDILLKLSLTNLP